VIPGHDAPPGIAREYLTPGRCLTHVAGWESAETYRVNVCHSLLSRPVGGVQLRGLRRGFRSFYDLIRSHRMPEGREPRAVAF